MSIKIAVAEIAVHSAEVMERRMDERATDEWNGLLSDLELSEQAKAQVFLRVCFEYMDGYQRGFGDALLATRKIPDDVSEDDLYEVIATEFRRAARSAIRHLSEMDEADDGDE